MPGAGPLQFSQERREGRVLVVTLARPEVGNALHGPASRELGALFDRFAADPGLSVAVVTGALDAPFCAGAEAGADAALPATGFAGLTARADLGKPVIAAVNGDATAEGFELALACDLIVAAEEAVFAPLPPGSPGAPAEGLTRRLLAEVPRKRAMAAVLTGAPISAAEGVLLGFVNDLCGRHDAAQVALGWAERILSRAAAGKVPA